MRSDIEIKMKLILRISLVTSICVLCYLLRIIVFSLAIYDVLYENNHSSYVFYNSSNVIWYLLIDWIPSLGPVSYLFLFIIYFIFI